MGFSRNDERLVVSELCPAVVAAIEGFCSTPEPPAAAAAAPAPLDVSLESTETVAVEEAGVAELLADAAGDASFSERQPSTGVLAARPSVDVRLSPLPPLPESRHSEAHGPVSPKPAAPSSPKVWACRRCTFHNCVLENPERCAMCASERYPATMTVGCSPIAVPEESTIRAMSVVARSTSTSPRLPATEDAAVGASPVATASRAVGSPVAVADRRCGTDPVAAADAACSPMIRQAPTTAEAASSPVARVATAEAGCSANIRNLRTPHFDPAARTAAGATLQHLRLQLAQAQALSSSRSESAPMTGPRVARAGAQMPPVPQNGGMYAPDRLSRIPSASTGTGPAPHGAAVVRDATDRSASTGVLPTQSTPLQDVTNCQNTAQPRAASKPASQRARSGTPLRKELASAMECNICLCLMVNPVTAPCGHSYCRHCLAEAVTKAGKKCPTCRAPCEMDVLSAPENKLIANMAKVANPVEYQQRCGEADVMLARLKRATKHPSLPVLIGDDCPCPGSMCRLQLAEPRDLALLRYIARNGGMFILLPTAEGGRVRIGAVGLHCTLRRAETLPNGQASASVLVGQRVLVRSHEVAAEGHTAAEHSPHGDTNEQTQDALAAAHNLKRLMSDFFATLQADSQRQVERFAGPEPTLPALRGGQGTVMPAASRYTFWVAAVLAHFRILSKRLKPSLVVQRDCLSRATTLTHILSSVLHAQQRQAPAGGHPTGPARATELRT
eukprot:TRINITY_DN13176_c0_g1_i2.p1 TRINITY_DN13176_c0_g1~~TRINITY_DN13176_c0_g1_i2.p1  ORF type:complete len:731 (+),score=73.91 TRINITY_DN13176_c0_g1_i2:61-2253(+)